MKDTGIKWIGLIPNDWQLKKVKNCFYISKEQANDKNPTVLSLARSGIKVRDISTNEGQLAASYENYNPVQPGDLLLNPMDLYSGANCNMSEVSGVISPAYVNLRAKINLNPKFFDYYFKTQYWAMAMFAHGKGVSFDNRWTMNAEAILNYWIPCPSLSKQNTIVDYLNKRCIEIDSLIEVQNKQIEQLKEFKQTSISELVTKGTDLNVSMKNSGINWIGLIPFDWSVCKLKYKLHLINGRAYKDDEFETNGKYRILRVGNLFSNPQWYTSSLELDENKYCSQGDLLYSWSMSYGPHIWQGEKVIYHYHIWKVLLEPDVDRDYAFYYLLALTNHIKSEIHETTMSFVTMGNMNDSYFVLPPIKQQRQIVGKIRIKCGEIDKLIEEKNEKIKKLEEYKKALVYECVTGKKEVVA